MYGEGDLADTPPFEGGYCNFGYWESVPDVISPESRAETSRALYRQILNELLPADRDRRGERLVEIGVGRGHGARLALEEYGAASVAGVDASPMQIERVRRFQHDLVERGRLDARVGTAEAMPLETAAFDALYSVEVLQHFQSIAAFAREAARVLAPHGRLALTTFFLRHEAHFGAVAQRIPTIARQITRITPIDALERQLRGVGFSRIHIASIGAHVFPGFDRWLETLGDAAGERDGWGRNWLRCFDAGWIDYYTVFAAR